LPDSSHLVARRLVVQDRVICASPDYLRRRGRPRSLADLKGHRAIVGSREGPPSAWVVRDNGVEKRIRPPAAHEMSDGEAMVDAAVAGFGMVQMPASLVRAHIEHGRLERVLEDVSTVPVEVHALWPRQAQLSPKVRYVVDQLVAHASQGRLD
jgi:DNA-binding transcriptional LysR family regulator